MSTRRTRRREAPRPVMVAAIGVAATLALALLIAVALRSPNGLPVVAYRDLNVVIDNPGNLQAHNDVRLYGVRIGQVVGIDKTAAGKARVKLRLDNDTAALPVDTTVALRGAGLLGARYVELRPGHSASKLGDGATLQSSDALVTYGVPDALNTLDPRARRNLGTGLRGLGAAVLGRGPVLNDATGAAPEVGENLKAIFAAPLARPGAAEALVPSLAAAAQALDGARDPIARGLVAGRRALEPLADEQAAMRATLQAAPPALRQATSGLDGGTALIAAAGSVARAANRTVPPLPAALRATASLLRRSPTPLARTTTLLRSADRAIPPTLTTLSALRPVLRPVQRLAVDLLPIVGQLAPRGCDIDNFAENWRSMLGHGVPRGGQSTPLPNGYVGGLAHLRVTALIDSESVQGYGRPATDGKSGAYVRPCESSPGPVYKQLVVGP